MNEPMNTRQKLLRGALLAAVFAALLFTVLGQNRQRAQAQSFGRPLFEHPLPAGAQLLQSEAKRDDAGVMTAAMLISSPDSQQELSAFFSDVSYPPFEEGERTRLQVLPLDAASLETLRQAGLYQEGAQDWFIYLTSEPAAGS